MSSLATPNPNPVPPRRPAANSLPLQSARDRALAARQAQAAHLHTVAAYYSTQGAQGTQGAQSASAGQPTPPPREYEGYAQPTPYPFPAPPQRLSQPSQPDLGAGTMYAYEDPQIARMRPELARLRAESEQLRAFYRYVTEGESPDARRHRQLVMAEMAGVALRSPMLDDGIGALDSDLMLQRWFAQVRTDARRAEEGDDSTSLFARLVGAQTYGRGYWEAMWAGERLHLEAREALGRRYDSDNLPNPRLADPAFRPESILEAAAHVRGVELIHANDAQRAQYLARLRSEEPDRRHRVFACLISSPTSALRPGEVVSVRKPAILNLYPEVQYVEYACWEIACLLGYFELLRPFFSGSGVTGDVKWLPDPRQDTSFTPHLHRFAKSLLATDEECPPEWGCQCARVEIILNRVPAKHPQQTDVLNGAHLRDAVRDAVRSQPAVARPAAIGHPIEHPAVHPAVVPVLAGPRWQRPLTAGTAHVTPPPRFDARSLVAPDLLDGGGDGRRSGDVAAYDGYGEDEDDGSTGEWAVNDDPRWHTPNLADDPNR